MIFMLRFLGPLQLGKVSPQRLSSWQVLSLEREKVLFGAGGDVFRKATPSLFSCLQCSALGLHLNLLLDRSQQFQDVAGSLRSWLQESEEAVSCLLLEPVSSDPAILQRQLVSAKVSYSSALIFYRLFTCSFS